MGRGAANFMEVTLRSWQQPNSMGFGHGFFLKEPPGDQLCVRPQAVLGILSKHSQTTDNFCCACQFDPYPLSFFGALFQADLPFGLPRPFGLFVLLGCRATQKLFPGFTSYLGRFALVGWLLRSRAKLCGKRQTPSTCSRGLVREACGRTFF